MTSPWTPRFTRTKCPPKWPPNMLHRILKESCPPPVLFEVCLFAPLWGVRLQWWVPQAAGRRSRALWFSTPGLYALHAHRYAATIGNEECEEGFHNCMLGCPVVKTRISYTCCQPSLAQFTCGYEVIEEGSFFRDVTEPLVLVRSFWAIWQWIWVNFDLI
jgi:hypothetical protein